MPAALTYYPPNSDDKLVKQILEAADDERRKRTADYTLALKYYDGQHKLPLKVSQGKANNNVILNDTKKAIDRTGAMLFPEFPNIEIDPLEGETAQRKAGKPTPDEKWLKDCWEWNEDAVLAQDAFQFGALSGHVFLRAVEQTQENPYPRVIAVPPENIIAWWKADDKDTVLWYQINVSVGKTEYQQDIVNMLPIDGSQTWKVNEYVKDGNKWVELNTSPTPWNYPLGPIIDAKHLRHAGHFYGQHELNIGLQDSINKSASDVKAILRTYASPRMIAFGAGSSGFTDTGIDSMWTIQDKDGHVDMLEMKGDLGSSLSFMDRLRDSFFAEARVVMLAGGPDAFRSITNLGIKAAFMDMLAKLEQLRRSYGKLIRETSKRLLMLEGKPYDMKYTLRWGQALPISELEETQVDQIQVNMGILSKQTAAADLGRDWEVEQENMDEEGSQTDNIMQKLIQQGGANPFMRQSMNNQQGMNNQNPQMNGQDMNGANGKQGNQGKQGANGKGNN